MQMVHNQVIATINLRQERGQTPPNFREQITAMGQVCTSWDYKSGNWGKSMGNSKKGRSDEPNQQAFGESNKTVIQRISCDSISVPS